MQALDIKNPNERKKLIIAGVLGLLALILLWWTFFGFGSKGTPVARQTGAPRATPTPTVRGNQPPPVAQDDLIYQLQPIHYEYSTPAVPEAKRNIFVYYEPPPKVVVEKPIPTPTPVPPPPVLLAGVNPGQVFARTGDFNLDVTGAKFTPQLKVFMDGQALPTRYVGAQQLQASVPAALIQNPGVRQVMLRTQDGALYSNVASFNIAAPPVPNYTYVGIIGSRRYIDTAILQDKTSKELHNAQRGDVVGGRFRVTSISEKELVLIDTSLKIKHSLTLSNSANPNNPLQRPAPRVESEDDEP